MPVSASRASGQGRERPIDNIVFSRWPASRLSYTEQRCSGDVVDGVESEGVVPGVAFVDQGLDVVAVEGAAAEAELHPEIGLRRAVDAGGVGVESGPPLVVGAVVGGAGSPTAAVGGWWRTVKIVAARGGIRVGGFLHEEAIAMKP